VILLWSPPPIAAQRVIEAGFHAVTTVAPSTLAGVGGYGAARVGERARIALTLTAAGWEGRWAARGELLGHFLLSPRRSHGVGVYGLGGVAGVLGVRDQGFAVLGLGVESRPGRRSGWALEIGAGGGLRVAAGYRWRRFPGSWVPGK
jgi:hypothetical protein